MTRAGVRILFFIPTYNENGNVERLCAELRGLGVGADVLFMDDGSPDGTGDTLDALARRHPEVHVIHRKGKLGIGSAHLEGIAYAYDRKYDLLVTLDADFSHEPRDILRLLDARQDDDDVVIGSRYLRRGSLPGWSPHRKFLTLFGHVLTRTLLGMPYDASGALRLYDLRRLPRELFDLVTATSYSFFFESLFVLHQNGCRVREIPIALPARVYGSSKLTWQEASRSGRVLLELWRTNLYRPERFRRGRPIDALRAEVVETQGWDGYWSEKKQCLKVVYDVGAGVYRRLVIRPNLRRFMDAHFAPGARVLHAGCGSGQVDVDLHGRLRVTAVDISVPALQLYARNNPRAYRIEQASIFSLPYEAGAFDGVFNLGVLEHFSDDEIRQILREFHRVLKPGGKIIAFWPHRWGTSVVALRALTALIGMVAREVPQLHPPEVSLVRSRRQVARLLESSGFVLRDYYFGVRDLFVQCVVVAARPAQP
jgi:dolichol-phosphate mannosyltransferase